MCDEILFSKSSTNTTIAINWIHIIKGQPEYLKKYNVKSYYFLKKIIVFLKRIINYTLYLIKSFFYKKSKFINSEKKILLISHLINVDQISNESDLYFGKLQKILNKKKISFLKIFINHTKENLDKLNLDLKVKNTIILPKYLNILEEIEIFLCQVKEFLRLKKEASQTNNLEKKFFIKETARSLFHVETAFALRLQQQIKKYIKKNNPKFIICTHEGYAWERLVFNAAKSVNPKIKCIGYQHTLFTKFQYSIKRKIIKKYNPDIIWTSGDFSNKELRNQKKLKGIKIINSGSFKNTNKLILKKNNIKRRVGCLVIPEGIFEECYKLFMFSISCAKIMPDINFIWRLHPSLDFKSVMKKMGDNIKIPENIIFSKNKNIENDIKLSRFALYRGSSSIATAFMSGLYPIYLRQKSELEIDPLYYIKFCNFKADTPAKFKNLLINFLNKKKTIHKKFKKRAWNNSEKCYRNLSEKVVINSLKIN